MLYRQDLVGLEVDDCCDQVTFVGEVVIHLRSAHRGGFLNVLDGGACHSVLGHQFGGGGDDPSSSRTHMSGQLVWCSGGHSETPSSESSLSWCYSRVVQSELVQAVSPPSTT